jgi:hypothetical protein
MPFSRKTVWPRLRAASSIATRFYGQKREANQRISQTRTPHSKLGSAQQHRSPVLHRDPISRQRISRLFARIGPSARYPIRCAWPRVRATIPSAPWQPQNSIRWWQPALHNRQTMNAKDRTGADLPDYIDWAHSVHVNACAMTRDPYCDGCKRRGGEMDKELETGRGRTSQRDTQYSNPAGIHLWTMGGEIHDRYKGSVAKLKVNTAITGKGWTIRQRARPRRDR